MQEVALREAAEAKLVEAYRNQKKLRHMMKDRDTLQGGCLATALRGTAGVRLTPLLHAPPWQRRLMWCTVVLQLPWSTTSATSRWRGSATPPRTTAPRNHRTTPRSTWHVPTLRPLLHAHSNAHSTAQRHTQATATARHSGTPAWATLRAAAVTPSAACRRLCRSWMRCLLRLMRRRAWRERWQPPEHSEASTAPQPLVVVVVVEATGRRLRLVARLHCEGGAAALMMCLHSPRYTAEAAVTATSATTAWVATGRQRERVSRCPFTHSQCCRGESNEERFLAEGVVHILFVAGWGWSHGVTMVAVAATQRHRCGTLGHAE